MSKNADLNFITTSSKEISQIPNKRSEFLYIDFLNLLSDHNELNNHSALIKDSCSNMASFPLLQVSMITSTLSMKLKSFTISPFGMENSPRMRKDGIVFFGIANKEIVYDFIFPREGKESDGSLLFVIFFNPYDLSYYIRDIEKGLGAFMKVSRYDVSDNSLINIGESYLVLSFETEAKVISARNNEKTMIVKVFNDKMKSQSLKFDPKKHNNGEVIRIGRANDCEVPIDDVLLSRIQCHITYENDKWVLYDGFDNKPSTNGTWSYLIEPTKITTEFIFKANHTLFKVISK